MLWTWPAIGFVPHCARARAARRRDAGADRLRRGRRRRTASVLLNLGADCPPHFERFDAAARSRVGTTRTSARPAASATASTGARLQDQPATTWRRKAQAMSDDADRWQARRRADRPPGSPRAKGEVPVLTEVVSDERAPRRAIDDAALEALARELERAVLERLGARDRPRRSVARSALGQALRRAELTVSVTQMVREAVARLGRARARAAEARLKCSTRASTRRRSSSAWYRRWEAAGYFRHQDPHLPDARPAYCIQLPPPNVTGTLHMGHAFQQTLMDALIRYHRMRGDNTIWVVGHRPRRHRHADRRRAPARGARARRATTSAARSSSSASGSGRSSRARPSRARCAASAPRRTGYAERRQKAATSPWTRGCRAP